MKRNLIALSVLVALSGCGTDSSSDNTQTESDFSLQLLHVADMDGSNAAVLANVSNFSALVTGFTSQHPSNTLFLSSGDNYIPGSRYEATNDDSMVDVDGIKVPGVARGDIAMLNAMGLQASAVGNHDLDGGSAEFATIIAQDGQYLGAQFPYLSANLGFDEDTNTAGLVVEDAHIASDIPNGLAATTIIEVNGEQIGIVGITTPTNDNITTTDDIGVYPANDSIDELVEIVQTKVDALVSQGINKVIALAHMQSITFEKELASKLRHVDIIVAGGSNTLLANVDDRLWAGDTIQGEYPILLKDADDNNIAIVNVDGDYKYLGRLVVDFDENGLIITDSINADESGPFITDDEMVNNTEGAVANNDVATIVSAIEDVILDSEGNIQGHTDVYLNGTRGYVRTEETNLGNLTADANLWYGQLHDSNVVISLKNGGGIRADIGYAAFPAGSTNPDDLSYYPPAAYPAANKLEGDISQYDIQSALAFNNSLAIVDITSEQLVEILEDGVAGVENIAGGFIHMGGMCITYDGTKTARQSDPETGLQTVAGDRIRSVTVDTNQDGNCDNSDEQVVVAGVNQLPGNSYKAITLSYLSASAPWPCVGESCSNQIRLEENAVMTTDPQLSDFAPTGTEQDALAEYLQAKYTNSDSAYDTKDSIDDGAADARIIRLDSSAI
ncbi:bifunctional metallophosphatase/5'-nucleotidase [Shewanella intestini]|uniref:Bifunctional metallophosphatase/5'-nucleotidase n=1 Tax=Shewanella intestini TaxID=2017544 RepID=A0ABS5I1V6_9GAMM|nr:MULTISPECIES: bifunctional metallophosphatase/5'-nucleotidase [Shewanella]MBR9728011.1 bifunctional metallophosphatase/5'-nucleotidase [Shewanella intestini]MRG36438.1 bifunctional metallophosphatase/5'-nucleotidase [Shewanella sp. XMDDZSB0408]